MDKVWKIHSSCLSKSDKQVKQRLAILCKLTGIIYEFKIQWLINLHL